MNVNTAPKKGEPKEEKPDQYRLAPASISESGRWSGLAVVERESDDDNPLVVKPEVVTLKDDENPVDPDDNYNEVICRNCVIYELVGCDRCGIFQYAYKHKSVKIKASKI